MNESFGQEYDHDVGTSREEPEPRRLLPHSQWRVYALAMVFIIAAGASYRYVSSERQQKHDLAAANQRLASSVAQLQKELHSMSNQLSELQARPAPPPPAPVRTQRSAHVRPAARSSVVREDPRLARIQSQLSEQQKQIAGARADIDRTKSDLSQTRGDLQSNIDSTKSELNGSIARTHDEVVALQKRGERNYYEFSIDKSKQYSRVGPLSIGLRKADTKHKRFNVAMLVDDNELQKNSVNLYETVWISLSDRPQPIELVVNKIAKDHIEGYLSEPKYKKSELSSTGSINPAKPVTAPAQ
jgi:hypothetical protein